MIDVQFEPRIIFVVLCVINLLNFVDRGIIPGSTQAFNSFIRHDIDTNTPDVYLGLLQSAFVIGFVVGSILFGNLIHHYPRFKLSASGLSVWILAVFLSGLSYNTGSYSFLLLARMLSGFGEASLQCTAPPWIEEVAPHESKGTWLAIFCAAIPVGTAIGYTYSSFVSTTIGWQFAFYFEGLVSVPLVIFLLVVSKQYPNIPAHSNSSGGVDGESELVGKSHSSTNRSSRTRRDYEMIGGRSDRDWDQTTQNVLHTTDADTTTSFYDGKRDPESPNNDHLAASTETTSSSNSHSPNAWQEFVAVMSSPIFVAIALGDRPEFE